MPQYEDALSPSSFFPRPLMREAKAKGLILGGFAGCIRGEVLTTSTGFSFPSSESSVASLLALLKLVLLLVPLRVLLPSGVSLQFGLWSLAPESIVSMLFDPVSSVAVSSPSSTLLERVKNNINY